MPPLRAMPIWKQHISKRGWDWVLLGQYKAIPIGQYMANLVGSIVALRQYRAILVGTLWYGKNKEGHTSWYLVVLAGSGPLPLPLYSIGLVCLYQINQKVEIWLTDEKTLKDRATQLLRSCSEALITHFLRIYGKF